MQAEHLMDPARREHVSATTLATVAGILVGLVVVVAFSSPVSQLASWLTQALVGSPDVDQGAVDRSAAAALGADGTVDFGAVIANSVMETVTAALDTTAKRLTLVLSLAALLPAAIALLMERLRVRSLRLRVCTVSDGVLEERARVIDWELRDSGWYALCHLPELDVPPVWCPIRFVAPRNGSRLERWRPRVGLAARHAAVIVLTALVVKTVITLVVSAQAMRVLARDLVDQLPDIVQAAGYPLLPSAHLSAKGAVAASISAFDNAILSVGVSTAALSLAFVGATLTIGRHAQLDVLAVVHGLHGATTTGDFTVVRVVRVEPTSHGWVGKAVREQGLVRRGLDWFRLEQLEPLPTARQTDRQTDSAEPHPDSTSPSRPVPSPHRLSMRRKAGRQPTASRRRPRQRHVAGHTPARGRVPSDGAT